MLGIHSVIRRVNIPQIKMLQLRATLSDEDNVIAERGTRGGILYVAISVSRDMSGNYQKSRVLQDPSIRKIEEGNRPMSVPATTK